MHDRASERKQVKGAVLILTQVISSAIMTFLVMWYDSDQTALLALVSKGMDSVPHSLVNSCVALGE